jgi:DNA-binding LytR/AlgR family response regulator
MLKRRHLTTMTQIGLVVLVSGTLLAFWAPYGTDSLGWPVRWIYWTGMNAAGWSIGLAAKAWVRARLRGQPAWRAYAIAALAASAAVLAASSAFHGVRGASWDIGNWINAALQVAVLVSAVTAVYALVRERKAPETPQPAVVGDALRERLPPALRGGEIDALNAEDHYLRVFIRGDSVLVRMSMRDALVAVARLEGARTHRSWWVARQAVERVRKFEGKAELTLRSGVIVPVSRSYAPGLRKAGWF